LKKVSESDESDSNSSSAEEPAPKPRKKKKKTKGGSKKIRIKTPQKESNSDDSSAEKSSSSESEEPTPKPRKKKKKKKTGSKKTRIKSPQEDSDSDNRPPKKNNKKKGTQPVKPKTQRPPPEDEEPQKIEKNEDVLELDIFAEPNNPEPQEQPEEQQEEEWADFATAKPETQVTSSVTQSDSKDVAEKESTSDRESWMDSFGPQTSTTQMSGIMNQSFGMFYGAGTGNVSQPQTDMNNMFQTNMLFPQGNVSMQKKDEDPDILDSFGDFQIGTENKIDTSNETSNKSSEEVSEQVDPFAHLMEGTNIGEKKNENIIQSKTSNSNESSSNQQLSNFFTQGIGNNNTNPGLSQMQGGIPQMQGGIPQMQGGIPQMQGMPQMNSQQAAAMMQMYQQQAQMQAQMYQQMYYAQQFLQQQQNQQNQQQNKHQTQQNMGSLPKQ